METRCRLSHNFFRLKLNQNSNPLFHIRLMEFLLSNSKLTYHEDCGLCTAGIKYCWYLSPVPKLEEANQRHLEVTRGTKRHPEVPRRYQEVSRGTKRYHKLAKGNKPTTLGLLQSVRCTQGDNQVDAACISTARQISD